MALLDTRGHTGGDAASDTYMQPITRWLRCHYSVRLNFVAPPTLAMPSKVAVRDNTHPTIDATSLATALKRPENQLPCLFHIPRPQLPFLPLYPAPSPSPSFPSQGTSRPHIAAASASTPALSSPLKSFWKRPATLGIETFNSRWSQSW
ncbi:hypothetical protein P692DRAFT_20882633 [Suillus brevipes Sb2]|nr:hypothetical protein P692DRAFT_20882633 [Suillus brevipes Sb2]